MTQWLHVTRNAWATPSSTRDAATEITAFFGPSVPVQLVGPSRRYGPADEEVIEPLAQQVPFTRDRRPAVVLLHPDEPQMHAITDGHYGYAELGCIIPWGTHRLLRAWLATQNTIGDPLDDRDQPSVHAVLAQALQTIARHRNPSSGIGHGYGKDGAVDGLRKLRAAGYTINPPALEKAAYQAGLRWDEVAQLRTYADGLTAGRRFVIGSAPWKANIVSLWEADAAAERISADSST